jgi:outer membrane protein TolC
LASIIPARLILSSGLIAALLAFPIEASAQAPAQSGAIALTLDQAIQYAADHYPSVRAAIEQVNASTASVGVARAAYLPRLDSLWQSNRATANNVFGQLLPQSVIPSLTGPVLPSASSQTVWGSAAGALLSWEPIDLGLRHATVAAADAEAARARADQALTVLEVQEAAASAFLDVVGASRAITAAQADVDRRDTLARAVHALVDNQLRPGAEASRVDAERAAAETRLIAAQELLAIARATLTRLLGVPAGTLTIDASTLLDHVPGSDLTPAAATAHPLAQVRQAAVTAARGQEDVLARTDRPRLFLESSVFARGSGANGATAVLDGSNGLGLDRANWAAGFQLVFPNAFDFASLRARKTAAAATERSEAARYDEALLMIGSERDTASAMVQAARAAAANTPVQLAAAQQAESQARVRYQTGLASIVEIADAQSLLAAAEFADQVARVDVWRALLAQSAAAGDLAPFVTLIRRP